MSANDMWSEIVSTDSTPKPVEQPKPEQIAKKVETSPSPPSESQPSSPTTATPQAATSEDPFATVSTAPAASPSPAPASNSDPFATVASTPASTSSATPAAPTPSADPFAVVAPAKKREHDLSHAKNNSNNHIMIYGKKGNGKTLDAMTIGAKYCACGALLIKGTTCPSCGKEYPADMVRGEKIAAVSFDDQTQIIAAEHFNEYDPEDPWRIGVWDGLRYFSEKDDETKLQSSDETYDYLLELLYGPIKEFQPDWIMFDGSEKALQFCEMRMRSREKVGPYEGFANKNLWKKRNSFLNELHRIAASIAKKGVIYTAYVEINEVTTATGEVKREEPKWAADIEQKVRIVVRAEGEKNVNGGKDFFAQVESSKNMKVPTGGRYKIGEVDREGNHKYYGFKVLMRGEI